MVSKVLAELANSIHFAGDYHAFSRKPASLDSRLPFALFFPYDRFMLAMMFGSAFLLTGIDIFDPQKTYQVWDIMHLGWTISRMAFTNGEYLPG